MLRHTSRDRSLTLTDLLQMKQGDDSWMQFFSDVEDAADLCGLDSKAREDAIRMVAGLRERCLADSV